MLKQEAFEFFKRTFTKPLIQQMRGKLNPLNKRVVVYNEDDNLLYCYEKNEEQVYVSELTPLNVFIPSIIATDKQYVNDCVGLVQKFIEKV